MTQLKLPPEIPGRFIWILYAKLGTRNNHSFAGALRRIEHPVRKIGGLNDLSSASPDTFRSLSASLAAFGRAYPVAAFLSWKIRRSKL